MAWIKNYDITMIPLIIIMGISFLILSFYFLRKNNQLKVLTNDKQFHNKLVGRTKALHECLENESKFYICLFFPLAVLSLMFSVLRIMAYFCYF